VVTTSPARSTSAIRISRERLPTETGSLSFRSDLAAAVKRNEPKIAVSPAPQAPLMAKTASVVLRLARMHVSRYEFSRSEVQLD
jgi:hypothetical protein